VEPLLADLDVAGKAGKYVMYVLAVAGGYLIGNLLTWLICRLMAKVVFKRHMNLKFERALRIFVGIVVAALIAFLLFRFGTGWGLGGSGSGEGEGSGGQAPNITDAAKEKQSKIEPKDPDAILSPVLQVRIERPTDYPRTFRFNGDAEGVDLTAAKKRLADLTKSSKGEPRLELRIYQNSTEAGHPDVRDLIDYAHTLRFSTRVEKINDRLP
jgi:hypothetical protein